MDLGLIPWQTSKLDRGLVLVLIASLLEKLIFKNIFWWINHMVFKHGPNNVKWHGSIYVEFS
jgi:hypothetical protein